VFLVSLFQFLSVVVPPCVLRLALGLLFPVQVILSERERDPYLTRWTLREYPDGAGHDYLHFFHRGDGDGSKLHSHPWRGRGRILAWGYLEERRFEDREEVLVAALSAGWRWPLGQGWGYGKEFPGYVVLWRAQRPGDETAAEPDTYHRVDLIQPRRGSWTLWSVGPRVRSWDFWDRATGEATPHGERPPVRPPFWRGGR
jgi:hypothetical protein